MGSCKNSLRMAAGVQLLIVVAGLFGVALGTRNLGTRVTGLQPTTAGDRTIPGIDIFGFFKCLIEGRACLVNKDCSASQFCDITLLCCAAKLPTGEICVGPGIPEIGGAMCASGSCVERFPWWVMLLYPPSAISYVLGASCE